MAKIFSSGSSPREVCEPHFTHWIDTPKEIFFGVYVHGFRTHMPACPHGDRNACCTYNIYWARFFPIQCPLQCYSRILCRYFRVYVLPQNRSRFIPTNLSSSEEQGPSAYRVRPFHFNNIENYCSPSKPIIVIMENACTRLYAFLFLTRRRHNHLPLVDLIW